LRKTIGIAHSRGFVVDLHLSLSLKGKVYFN
jgi:hypothetical protein